MENTETTEQTNDIVTTEAIELVAVIKDSGLEKPRAQQITDGYLPFLSKINEVAEQSKKVNFENPGEIDEKMCRLLRLSLVPNRTAADKFKKQQKAEATLINGLHDNCYGVIEKSSKLLEAKLEAVEKAAEVKAKKAIEDLKTTRLAELSPYMENADIYPLGLMNEEAFTDLLSGAKLQFENKEEAKRKAATEKAEREEKERQEAEAAKQKQIDLENSIKEIEAQKAETEAKLQAEKDAAAAAAKEAADREAAIKAEADAKLESERKAAQDAADKAKAEAEAAAKAAEEAAARLKAKADAELQAEKDKAAKALKEEEERANELARELEAKLKAEAAAAAKEAEEKAKAEADAIRAAKAPDKTKLRVWVGTFVEQPIYKEGLHEDSLKIAAEISNKFEAFKAWADKLIDESFNK